MAPSTLPAIPLLLALALAGHGLRKRSLSPPGAAAALLVGASMMAVPLRTFGLALIGFYLAGSRATKVGSARKRVLEEGHDAAAARGAVQVACNALGAWAAALLWSGAFVDGERDIFAAANALLVEALGVPRRLSVYEPAKWCAVDSAVGGGWSRTLVLAALGHFACCCGDTLASELGILSKTQPRLITTLRPVPPGTNGGMSMVGTLASLAGGLLMGILMAASLLVENPACRASAISAVVLPLLAYGALGGLFGSLLDSLLGATVQKTRYAAKSGLVLQDGSARAGDADVKVISGVGILTNNQVNLVSSIATALLLGYLA